jgi:hypothetical protein
VRIAEIAAVEFAVRVLTVCVTSEISELASVTLHSIGDSKPWVVRHVLYSFSCLPLSFTISIEIGPNVD